MNTIPDLDYKAPALNSEILEQMLDHLYCIVPLTKSVASSDTDETTRQEYLARIYETTIRLGKSLILLKQDADYTDNQIKSLIAYAKQRTTPGLN